MLVEVLRNPVHLFRSDGVIVRLPLFAAVFLPRGEKVAQEINRAVAYRHLLSNRIPPHFPRSPLLKPQFYTSKLHFEFRTEDAHPSPYRLKSVLLGHSKAALSSVQTHHVLRKCMRVATAALPKYAQRHTDLILQCSQYGLIAGEREVERELISAMHYADICAVPTDFHLAETILPSASDIDIYSRVLIDTYRTHEKRFAQQCVLFAKELRTPMSEFAYMIEKCGGDQEAKFKYRRTLTLKAWCFHRGIDRSLIALLRMRYVELLSFENKLQHLPTILDTACRSVLRTPFPA